MSVASSPKVTPCKNVTVTMVRDQTQGAILRRTERCFGSRLKGPGDKHPKSLGFADPKSWSA